MTDKRRFVGGGLAAPLISAVIGVAANPAAASTLEAKCEKQVLKAGLTPPANARYLLGTSGVRAARRGHRHPVEHATKPVSPMTQILLVHGGGAIARVEDDATAFGQRDAPLEHPLPLDLA